MHLVSEKKLIYAVLTLTVVFFVALLSLPALTHSNGYWIHEPPSEVQSAPTTRSTSMNLRVITRS